MFQHLLPAPPDPLLNLIKLYNEDTRDNKIDLGVGVYRNPEGGTPILTAVKKAEQVLLDTQESKSYLGMAGDLGYVDALQKLVFGENHPALTSNRIVGAQTPGGSGALRLGAELIRASNPEAKIWVGTPTWPNHTPIFDAAGVASESYPYFDIATQSVTFDAMMEALSKAPAGDAVLLHGCCHNPTGGNLSPEQWVQVVDLCVEKQLVPFVDLAYHGLGSGLEADCASVRLVAEKLPEAIFALSCSKNFGLYRDRIGAVCVLAEAETAAQGAVGKVATAARSNYSMPPDHGAAVVRLILNDEALRAEWLAELDSMADRINSLRKELSEAAAAKGVDYDFVQKQQGMFSTLPIEKDVIERLRVNHGIYMAGSGRINIAGFKAGDCARFIDALVAEQGN